MVTKYISEKIPSFLQKETFSCLLPWQWYLSNKKRICSYGLRKAELLPLKIYLFTLRHIKPAHAQMILGTAVWLQGLKKISCSTQLSMKFFLLTNVKLPTIVGILTFMSRKNSILGLSEPEKSLISWYFYTYEHLKFHAQLSWAWNIFITSGPNYRLHSNSYNFKLSLLSQVSSMYLWQLQE